MMNDAILNECVKYQYDFGKVPIVVLGKSTARSMKEEKIKYEEKQFSQYVYSFYQKLLEDDDIVRLFGYNIEIGDFEFGFILK